jgi:hypothetical protein
MRRVLTRVLPQENVALFYIPGATMLRCGSMVERCFTSLTARERLVSDRVKLSSLRTRFRIAEEEAEVAFIDRVQLNLGLRNGRILQLRPTRSDNLVIRAYTNSEINFDLPEGITSSDILTSELEVVGYYRRRSELFSATDLDSRLSVR